MAPAASKLRAGAGLGALPQRALAQYLRLLRLYPVLTKAATSGILSALGNFLAQLIVKKREKENSQKLDVIGPLRYAIYGFFFTGPLSHFFYVFMEHWIPSEVPLAGLKRLLLDRLLFAPAFLLLFFLIMNFLETDHGYVGRTCWATGRRRLDTTRHLLQNIFYVSWPLLPASSPVTVSDSEKGVRGIHETPDGIAEPCANSVLNVTSALKRLP
uniref:peroxisomal membrane protein 2 isoform X4 n=1 Tax=Halichoerus grypus TaxID=9711 RepID=UPI001659285E|nr:peroxisomal membrane protein 2 isoform X4 [Halichoerus grypus]